MQTHIVADEFADLGGTGIGGRNDLDELGLVDILGLGGGEGGLEVDAPVGAQPDKGLECEDGAGPDEGPLRRLEILVVELWGQVVAQEDGPEDRKGPDVGMEAQRQWFEKFGVLDLRVIHERRHRGILATTSRRGFGRETGGINYARLSRDIERMRYKKRSWKDGLVAAARRVGRRKESRKRSLENEEQILA